MKIAIDFDDTIVCTKEKVKEFMKKHNIDSFTTTDLKKDFYQKNIEDIFNQIELKKDVKKYLDLLSKDHELYIITARTNYYHSYLTSLTEQYIKEHKLPIKKIYFDCIYEGKADKCEELNIDLFIDDNIENCLHVQNRNIKTILFESVYQELRTMNSWEEIYNYIKED